MTLRRTIAYSLTSALLAILVSTCVAAQAVSPNQGDAGDMRMRLVLQEALPRGEKPEPPHLIGGAQGTIKPMEDHKPGKGLDAKVKIGRQAVTFDGEKNIFGG